MIKLLLVSVFNCPKFGCKKEVGGQTGIAIIEYQHFFLLAVTLIVLEMLPSFLIFSSWYFIEVVIKGKYTQDCFYYVQGFEREGKIKVPW